MRIIRFFFFFYTKRAKRKTVLYKTRHLHQLECKRWQFFLLVVLLYRWEAKCSTD